MPHYVAGNACAALTLLTNYVAITVWKTFLTERAVGTATTLEVAVI